MALDHEYTILGGTNRATIGGWLRSLAALISAMLVFIVLSLVDVAKSLGVNANIPPTIFSLIGAGMVYLGLYALFNNVLWKNTFAASFMKIPVVSGKWKCKGKTSKEHGGFEWEGNVTIAQKWDKLCITLETNQSRSHSVSASLMSEATGSHRILYHYKNEPNALEDDIQAHHGFVDMVISPNCQTGLGYYFNGRGRQTFGEMTWTRSE